MRAGAVIKKGIKKTINKIYKGKYNYHRRVDFNELQNDQVIIRQGTPECFSNMPLKIHWMLTSACNYRCSYCFDKNSGYEEGFCSLEQAEQAIRHLASANRPSYQVSLLGGEPTMHPHLAEIITMLGTHLGESLEKISIITNGSFNDKTLQSILKASDKTNIEIKFSVHFEFVELEKVVSLIESISKDVTLVFLIMLHPLLFDKAKYTMDTLCELRKVYPFDISIDMIRETSSKYDHRYTEEHFRWAKATKMRFDNIAGENKIEKPYIPKEGGWEFDVESRDERVVANARNISEERLLEITDRHFSGMMCCAGTSVIDIKCGGLARGLVCNLAKYGCNIYENNPFEDENWIHGIQCTKEKCGCNIDFRVPKFLSEEAADVFIAEKRREQREMTLEYLNKRKMNE